MISVDTNIIIRLLTRDDETQFRKVYRLFEAEDIFIPDTVIMESEWVLRFAYEFDPGQVSDALTRLFGLPNVHLSSPQRIAQAIEWHRRGLDFANALHLSHSQEQHRLVTFDKKFIAQAKGCCNCSVIEP